MELQAKARLLSEVSEADKSAKNQVDQQIENKKSQVENLKRSMPSRENRMSVSPDQRNRTEKQIHRTQEETSDLRLKKSKIGN